MARRPRPGQQGPRAGLREGFSEEEGHIGSQCEGRRGAACRAAGPDPQPESTRPTAGKARPGQLQDPRTRSLRWGEGTQSLFSFRSRPSAVLWCVPEPSEAHSSVPPWAVPWPFHGRKLLRTALVLNVETLPLVPGPELSVWSPAEDGVCHRRSHGRRTPPATLR